MAKPDTSIFAPSQIHKPGVRVSRPAQPVLTGFENPDALATVFGYDNFANIDFKKMGEQASQNQKRLEELQGKKTLTDAEKEELKSVTRKANAAYLIFNTGDAIYDENSSEETKILARAVARAKRKRSATEKAGFEHKNYVRRIASSLGFDYAELTTPPRESNFMNTPDPAVGSGAGSFDNAGYQKALAAHRAINAEFRAALTSELKKKGSTLTADNILTGRGFRVESWMPQHDTFRPAVATAEGIQSLELAVDYKNLNWKALEVLEDRLTNKSLPPSKVNTLLGQLHNPEAANEFQPTETQSALAGKLFSTFLPLENGRKPTQQELNGFVYRLTKQRELTNLENHPEKAALINSYAKFKGISPESVNLKDEATSLEITALLWSGWNISFKDSNNGMNQVAVYKPSGRRLVDVSDLFEIKEDITQQLTTKHLTALGLNEDQIKEVLGLGLKPYESTVTKFPFRNIEEAMREQVDIIENDAGEMLVSLESELFHHIAVGVKSGLSVKEAADMASVLTKSQEYIENVYEETVREHFYNRILSGKEQLGVGNSLVEVLQSGLLSLGYNQERPQATFAIGQLGKLKNDGKIGDEEYNFLKFKLLQRQGAFLATSSSQRQGIAPHISGLPPGIPVSIDWWRGMESKYGSDIPKEFLPRYNTIISGLRHGEMADVQTQQIARGMVATGSIFGKPQVITFDGIYREKEAGVFEKDESTWQRIAPSLITFGDFAVPVATITAFGLITGPAIGGLATVLKGGAGLSTVLSVGSITVFQGGMIWDQSGYLTAEQRFNAVAEMAAFSVVVGGVSYAARLRALNKGKANAGAQGELASGLFEGGTEGLTWLTTWDSPEYRTTKVKKDENGNNIIVEEFDFWKWLGQGVATFAGGAIDWGTDIGGGLMGLRAKNFKPTGIGFTFNNAYYMYKVDDSTKSMTVIKVDDDKVEESKKQGAVYQNLDPASGAMLVSSLSPTVLDTTLSVLGIKTKMTQSDLGVVTNQMAVFDPKTKKFVALSDMVQQAGVETMGQFQSLFDTDGPLSEVGISPKEAAIGVVNGNSKLGVLSALNQNSTGINLDGLNVVTNEGKQLLDDMVAEGLVSKDDNGTYRITEEGNSAREAAKKSLDEFKALVDAESKKITQQESRDNKSNDLKWHEHKNDKLRKLGYTQEQIDGMTADQKKEVVKKKVQAAQFTDFMQKNPKLAKKSLAQRSREEFEAKGGEYEALSNQIFGSSKTNSLAQAPVSFDVGEFDKLTDAEKEVIVRGVVANALSVNNANGLITSGGYGLSVNRPDGGKASVYFGVDGYENYLTYLVGMYRELGDVNSSNTALQALMQYRGQDTVEQADLDSVLDDYRHMTNFMDLSEDFTGYTGLLKSQKESILRKLGAPVNLLPPKPIAQTTARKADTANPKSLRAVDFSWENTDSGADYGDFVAVRDPNVRGRSLKVYSKNEDGTYSDVNNSSDTVTAEQLAERIKADGLQVGRLNIAKAPAISTSTDTAISTQQAAGFIGGPKAAKEAGHLSLTSEQMSESEETLKSGKGTLHLTKDISVEIDVDDPFGKWTDYADGIVVHDPKVSGEIFINQKMYRLLFPDDTEPGVTFGIAEQNASTTPNEKSLPDRVNDALANDFLTDVERAELEKLKAILQENIGQGQKATAVTVINPVALRNANAVVSGEITPYRKLISTVRHEFIHKVLIDEIGHRVFGREFIDSAENVLFNTVDGKAIIQAMENVPGNSTYKSIIARYKNATSRGEKDLYMSLLVHELLAHGSDVTSLSSGLGLVVHRDLSSYVKVVYNILNEVSKIDPALADKISNYTDPEISAKINKLYDETNRLENSGPRFEGGTDATEGTSVASNDGQTSSDPAGVREDAAGAEPRRVGPLRSADIEQRDRATFLSEKQYKDSLKSEKKGSGPTHLTKELVIDYSDDRFDRDSDPDFLQDPADSDMVVVNRNMMIAVFDFTDGELTWGNPWRFNALNDVLGGEIANKERVSQLIVAHMAQAKLTNNSLYREYKDIYPKLGQYLEAITGKSFDEILQSIGNKQISQIIDDTKGLVSPTMLLRFGTDQSYSEFRDTIFHESTHRIEDELIGESIVDALKDNGVDLMDNQSFNFWWDKVIPRSAYAHLDKPHSMFSEFLGFGATPQGLSALGFPTWKGTKKSHMLYGGMYVDLMNAIAEAYSPEKATTIARYMKPKMANFIERNFNENLETGIQLGIARRDDGEFKLFSKDIEVERVQQVKVRPDTVLVNGLDIDSMQAPQEAINMIKLAASDSMIGPDFVAESAEILRVGIANREKFIADLLDRGAPTKSLEFGGRTIHFDEKPFSGKVVENRETGVITLDAPVGPFSSALIGRTVPSVEVGMQLLRQAYVDANEVPRLDGMREALDWFLESPTFLEIYSPARDIAQLDPSKRLEIINRKMIAAKRFIGSLESPVSKWTTGSPAEWVQGRILYSKDFTPDLVLDPAKFGAKLEKVYNEIADPYSNYLASVMGDQFADINPVLAVDLADVLAEKMKSARNMPEYRGKDLMSKEVFVQWAKPLVDTGALPDSILENPVKFFDYADYLKSKGVGQKWGLAMTQKFLVGQANTVQAAYPYVTPDLFIKFAGRMAGIPLNEVASFLDYDTFRTIIDGTQANLSEAAVARLFQDRTSFVEHANKYALLTESIRDLSEYTDKSPVSLYSKDISKEDVVRPSIADPVDGFFDPILAALESPKLQKVGKTTGEQWYKLLQNTPGVKKENLDWSVGARLLGPSNLKRSMTYQELKDLAQESRIVLERHYKYDSVKPGDTIEEMLISKVTSASSKNAARRTEIRSRISTFEMATSEEAVRSIGEWDSKERIPEGMTWHQFRQNRLDALKTELFKLENIRTTQRAADASLKYVTNAFGFPLEMDGTKYNQIESVFVVPNLLKGGTSAYSIPAGYIKVTKTDELGKTLYSVAQESSPDQNLLPWYPTEPAFVDGLRKLFVGTYNNPHFGTLQNTLGHFRSNMRELSDEQYSDKFSNTFAVEEVQFDSAQRIDSRDVFTSDDTIFLNQYDGRLFPGMRQFDGLFRKISSSTFSYYSGDTLSGKIAMGNDPEGFRKLINHFRENGVTQESVNQFISDAYYLKYGPYITAAKGADRFILENSEQFMAGLEAAASWLDFREANKAKFIDLSTKLPNAVPEMPFMDNWTEISAKSTLRMASELGAEHFIWTAGETQSVRYGKMFANNIGEVNYEELPDKTSTRTRAEIAQEMNTLYKEYRGLLLEYDRLRSLSAMTSLAATVVETGQGPAGTPLNVAPETGQTLEDNYVKLEYASGKNTQRQLDIKNRMRELKDELYEATDTIYVSISDKKGNIVKEGYFSKTGVEPLIRHPEYQLDKLKDFIGATGTKKISESASSTGTIQGKDLDKGNKFYDELYDNKYFRAVKKYADKHGLTIEKKYLTAGENNRLLTERSSDADSPVWYMPLNESIKKDLMGGVPLYSKDRNTETRDTLKGQAKDVLDNKLFSKEAPQPVILPADVSVHDGFYSNIEAVLSGFDPSTRQPSTKALQNKALAKEWLNILQKTPGIKKEELVWSGIYGLLESNPDRSMTLQDLKEVIRVSKVTTETMYNFEDSDSSDFTTEAPEDVYKIANEELRWPDKVARGASTGIELVTEVPLMRKGLTSGLVGVGLTEADLPKGYTVTRAPNSLPYFPTWVVKNADGKTVGKYNAANADDAVGAFMTERFPLFDPGFRYPTHFENRNFVVHSRNTIREVDGVRTFYLEEMQSDLHAKGRDKGYFDLDKARANRQEFQAALEKYNDFIESSGLFMESPEGYGQVGQFIKNASIWIAETQNLYKDRVENGESIDWAMEYEIAERADGFDFVGVSTELNLSPIDTLIKIRQLSNLMAEVEKLGMDVIKDNYTFGQEQVPAAPFEQNWMEVGLKRAIHEAARQGAAKFMWTTGTNQVDRNESAMKANIDTLEYDVPTLVANQNAQPQLTRESQLLDKYKATYDKIYSQYDELSRKKQSLEISSRFMPGSPEVQQKRASEMEQLDRQMEPLRRNLKGAQDLVDRQTKIVDALKASMVDAKTVRLTGTKGGVIKFKQTMNLNGTTNVQGQNVTLEQIIGKEMAKKIREDKSGQGKFEGDELTIGGDFYKFIYDDKMVKAVAKIFKQYGITPTKEMVQLADETTDVREITEDQTGFTVANAARVIFNAKNKANLEIKVTYKDGGTVVTSRAEDLIGEFDIYAQRFVQGQKVSTNPPVKLEITSKAYSEEVWSFDIPEVMAQEARQGFPLYSKDRMTLGDVRQTSSDIRNGIIVPSLVSPGLSTLVRPEDMTISDLSDIITNGNYMLMEGEFDSTPSNLEELMLQAKMFGDVYVKVVEGYWEGKKSTAVFLYGPNPNKVKNFAMHYGKVWGEYAVVGGQKGKHHLTWLRESDGKAPHEVTMNQYRLKIHKTRPKVNMGTIFEFPDGTFGEFALDGAGVETPIDINSPELSATELRLNLIWAFLGQSNKDISELMQNVSAFTDEYGRPMFGDGERDSEGMLINSQPVSAYVNGQFRVIGYAESEMIDGKVKDFFKAAQFFPDGEPNSEWFDEQNPGKKYRLRESDDAGVYSFGENLYKVRGQAVNLEKGMEIDPLSEDQIKEAHKRSLTKNENGQWMFKGKPYDTIEEVMAVRPQAPKKDLESVWKKSHTDIIRQPNKAVMFAGDKGIPVVMTRLLMQKIYDKSIENVLGLRPVKPSDMSGEEGRRYQLEAEAFVLSALDELVNWKNYSGPAWESMLNKSFFGETFRNGLDMIQEHYPEMRGEVGDRVLQALFGMFTSHERIASSANWLGQALERISSMFDGEGNLVATEGLSKLGIHDDRVQIFNEGMMNGMVPVGTRNPEYAALKDSAETSEVTREVTGKDGKTRTITKKFYRSEILAAYQDTYGKAEGYIRYLNHPFKKTDRNGNPTVELGAQVLFGPKVGAMMVMSVNGMQQVTANDIHVYRYISTILGLNANFYRDENGNLMADIFPDGKPPLWIRTLVDNVYTSLSNKYGISPMAINQVLVYGPALNANSMTFASSTTNDLQTAVEKFMKLDPEVIREKNPALADLIKTIQSSNLLADLKAMNEEVARFNREKANTLSFSKDRESLQAQQEILAQTDEALNNMDPDAWIAVAERLVTHNKLADSEKEAIRLLAQQGRRDDLQKYVLSLSKQSVLELFVNVGRVSLLLGLKNIQKNVGGNSLRQFMDEISRIPASILDTVFIAFNRAIGGQNFDRSTTSILTNPADTLAAWKYALGKGATEGGKQFIDILRGDNADVVFEHPSLFRERTTGWRILKPLEIFEKYGWRFQGAMDRPFNAAAYYRTLHELQMMRMREEHKAGNKITFEEAEEYLTQADFELAEMYSLQATYQKKNVLADKYYSMIDGLPPTWRAIVSNIFKFVKTPLNVVDYVLDYTGIWQIAKLAHREYGTKDWVSWKSSVKKVLDNPQDRKILSMAISQGAIGTVMTYIGYMMAQAGLMMPWFDREEKKEGEQMEAKGTSWGEAIIGGKSVDISWLSPNSFYLMMGATMFSVDNTHNRRLDELTEKLERAKAEGDAGAIEKAEQELNKHRNSSPKEEMFSRIFKNFALQAPFLRQIDDIKTSYDQNRLLSGLGEKWFSPEVYVPAIVKEIARTKDQYARVTTDVSTLERMTEKVQANIPSLPGVRRVGKALEDTGIFGVRNVGKLLQGREALPIKYDMYGRPIQTGSGLEATSATQVKTDKLTTEMDRLNVTISKPTGATTVEENRLRKEKGEKYTPYLERAIQSPEYQKSDDKTKKRILEQTIKFLNENRADKLDKKEEQHNLAVLADREFYRAQLRNNPGQFAKEAVITDKETVSAFVSAGLSSSVSFNEVISDITKNGNLDQWVNAKFNYEFTVSDRQPLVDAQRNYEEFRKDPQSYIIRLWARDKRAQESRERNQELRAKLFDEGKDKEQVEKELRKQSNRRGAETRRRQGSVRQITVTR